MGGSLRGRGGELAFGHVFFVGLRLWIYSPVAVGKIIFRGGTCEYVHPIRFNYTADLLTNRGYLFEDESQHFFLSRFGT